MPEIAYTVLADNRLAGNRFTIVQWADMADGDTGQPYEFPHYSDRSVQVSGTFGVGGNCRVEGSNMLAGTPTYATLNDPGGNALDIAAAKVEQVLEATNLIRPNITAGDGDTSLTVTLLIVSK